MDFEQIYSQYFKDVYAYMLAVSRDRSTAEEITQETFFKALKNLHKFRGECTIKVWLCQIAKNTYLTRLKRSKRDIHETEGNAVECSPEDLLIKKENAISIYKVLHCLEEPYKEVFTLRVLGDLSFGEIGEVFGHKEGWARVTFHRARQKLREVIGGDGNE